MNEFESIKSSLRHVQTETKRTFIALNWRIDTNACQAREELLRLKTSISVDADNPAKILRVRVGNREYTSVRRIEGTELYKTGRSEFGPEATFYIDSDLIPDQAVGVLVVPDYAICLNDDISSRYEKYVQPWLFPVAMADGVPYKSRDWKISDASLTLVQRVRDRFYKLGSAGAVTFEAIDRFDRQEIISLLKPDGQGKLNLGTAMNFSEAEFAVVKGWYESRGRFYVLTEGSTDRQKGSNRQISPVKHASASQII